MRIYGNAREEGDRGGLRKFRESEVEIAAKVTLCLTPRSGQAGARQDVSYLQM